MITAINDCLNQENIVEYTSENIETVSLSIGYTFSFGFFYDVFKGPKSYFFKKTQKVHSPS